MRPKLRIRREQGFWIISLRDPCPEGYGALRIWTACHTFEQAITEARHIIHREAR